MVNKMDEKLTVLEIGACLSWYVIREKKLGLVLVRDPKPVWPTYKLIRIAYKTCTSKNSESEKNYCSTFMQTINYKYTHFAIHHQRLAIAIPDATLFPPNLISLIIFFNFKRETELQIRIKKIQNTQQKVWGKEMTNDTTRETKIEAIYKFPHSAFLKIRMVNSTVL